MLMLVPGVRRAIAVQALRQLLVDVDHQRILLRRIEVLRLGQDRAQLLAVGVEVLASAPSCPRRYSACCGLAFDTFFMSRKLVSLTQRSGNSSKRDSVKTRRSAFFALVIWPNALSQHHDLLGRGRAGQADAVEAAVLGPVVVGREQQRLVGRDRALLGIERAIAEDDLLLAPVAAGDHARAAAVGLHLPDVVLVVEQRPTRSSAVQPAVP